MSSVDLSYYVMAVKFPGQSDNQGTAFLISSEDNGYVVTCYHVVADHTEIDLHFRHGHPPVKAELAPDWSDEAMDIAVLRLAEPKPSELRMLDLSTQLCTGQHFRSFGFTKGSSGLGATGTIECLVQPVPRAPRTLDDGLFQLGTKDVVEGMSGAPVVLSGTDTVVGMIVAGHKTLWNVHDDLAFAQTIKAVQSVCRDLIPLPPITGRGEWIEALGFRFDPFSRIDGGHDPDLLHYFFRVPSFADILGNEVSRPETVLVFGDTGSGKSSLRNAIGRMSSAEGALPVVLRDFGPLVDRVREEHSIQRSDHLTLILKATIAALFAGVTGEGRKEATAAKLKAEDTRDIRNYLWSYVSEYETDHVRKTRFAGLLGVDEKTDCLILPADDRERLIHLCRYIVELFGYKSVILLIDPDGDVSSDYDVAWKVLNPLLSAQRLLELAPERVAFKFFLHRRFLDQALQIPWIERIAATRVNTHSLEWSDEKLHALVQERLKQCSEKLPPYESLGQLSPEVQDLDKIVIRRSQNQPRRLIEICNKLFSVHCQSPIDRDQLRITRAEVNEAIRQFGVEGPVSKIAQMIEQGEGQLVEFKVAMRYNTKAKRRDQEMDKEVARALSGFMNAQGGTLIIGVDDEGRAVGLEDDISTLGKKNEDGFELAFTQIVTRYLKLPDRGHTKVYFEDYDCRRVFVVEVEASEEPVYCLFDEHEFYIRVGNSTRKLDVKHAVDYIQKRFQPRVSQESRGDTHTESTYNPEDLN
jgi:hypothetical protein